jgi:5-methylcytosine-specific restriction endonuclease McrA
VARRIQANPRDRVETATMWRSAPRPVDWPARVAAVKARDQSCRWIQHGRICGSVENIEVDHIGDPRDHRLENLRALCRSHHRARTGQQAGQAAAAKRIPRKRPAERHPGLL